MIYLNEIHTHNNYIYKKKFYKNYDKLFTHVFTQYLHMIIYKKWIYIT